LCFCFYASLPFGGDQRGREQQTERAERKSCKLQYRFIHFVTPPAGSSVLPGREIARGNNITKISG
jgi:hypothetical protein